MKKIIKLGALAAVLFLAGFVALSAEGQPEQGRGNGSGTKRQGQGQAQGVQGEGLYRLLEELPLQELDESEVEGLLLMREEEKLARDVYTVLYEKWNLNVFRNIAGSEETHMDAVGALLERYSIDDPVREDIPGEFSNSALALLYGELVEQGSSSLTEAILAGATIEDLDISDLLDLIASSDNDDIKIVYQNLLKGSRNHLRSFVYQSEKNGGEYTPRYISDQLYAKIIGSEKETGSQITDPNFSF